LLAPASSSLALWPGKQSLLAPAERVEALRRAIAERVLADAGKAPKRTLFASRAPTAPWPGEELAARTLLDVLGELSTDFAERSLLLASLLDGRVCDPALAGGALQLLAGTRGGMVAGGLGRLGEALRAAAVEAGAEITCGLEATDIKRKARRVAGVGLADGSEIAARAVISTLDLKRTFLSLFSWSELPRALVEGVGAFRPAPGTARLLVALEKPRPAPCAAPFMPRPTRWRSTMPLAPGGGLRCRNTRRRCCA
jgi:phytoene dehydrogenase-like protein